MALRLLLLLLLVTGVVGLLSFRKVRVGYEKGRRESRWLNEVAAPDESDPEAFIAAIPGMAERHRELMEKNFGETMIYAKRDFGRLDKIIEKGWKDGAPKDSEALVRSFGAYFGEAIRRMHGGKWVHDSERGFGLESVGGKASIYPFEKVRKRFQNGQTDSLLTFYLALNRMLNK